MTFSSRFAIFEYVYIDGEKSIRAIVTAITFRSSGIVYELSWFANGDVKVAFVDEARLEKWTD